MSAPLPQPVAARGEDPFAGTFAPRGLTEIPERDTHIFSEYVPHVTPQEIVVRQDGVPLLGADKQPYTVADVAPERRWAIGADGEVMPQHVYEAGLVRFREEWYEKVKGQKVPADMRKEAVPNVRKYVSFTVDPTTPSRLRLIGYDPRATAGKRAEVLWDKNGENPITGGDRLRILLDTYHNPSTRSLLKPHELAEVEGHLGGAIKGETDVAAKLSALTDLLAAGDISQEVYVKRVAALTGNTAPDTIQPAPEPKPRRQPGRTVMACGETVLNLHKKRHEAKCGICAPATDTTGGDDAA